MYRVAVLLPTYNSEHFILQQITSITLQRNVSVELFVYDDFSTDLTPEILNKISKLHPIKVYPSIKKFGSASGSFFYLLKQSVDYFAYFDFVAFADHDDIWMSDKLIEAINLIEGTQSVCYSSSATPIKSSSKIGIKPMSGGTKSSAQKRFDYVFEGPGPGCTFVFKSNFAINLSKFLTLKGEKLTSVFWHDWFIYAYSKNKNYKWIIDPRSFILYMQHGSNETGVNAGLAAKVRRLKALCNGFYLFQARNNLALIDQSSTIYSRLIRFNLFDRVWFAINIFSMRRRIIDSIALLFLLILNPFSLSSDKKFTKYF